MASLLDLAQARLQGLLDIPTRAVRAIVNPTAFSGLLGAPILPQMQGTAEAAYGLPARQNMSVLDPNQAAYLQGYQQGEPLAYLGMATPFAAPAAVAGAKAVAPKAGIALENYMASQGLLQPLTAYHGTPHTIRGKFDISKVGTGEGAQSYGHGMYFAENPAVAESYKIAGAAKYGDPDAYANMIVKTYSNNPDKALKVLNNIMPPQGQTTFSGESRELVENAIKSIQSGTYKGKEVGNLYKVDIPDEYIPNMLDWDKPLSQQNEILKKINPQSLGLSYTKLPNGNHAFVNSEGQTFGMLQKGGTAESFEKNWTEDLMQGTGADFYKKFGQSMFGKDAVKASEALNNAGIKGIRYLDEGSREAGKGTSNFVVFDPTDVKILEKNSQKVEGLLD